MYKQEEEEGQEVALIRALVGISDHGENEPQQESSTMQGWLKKRRNEKG